MEVYFCDRCSRRITEGDLRNEEAFSFGRLTFCRTCWEAGGVRDEIKRASGLLSAVAPASAADGGHAGHANGQVERGRAHPMQRSARRLTPRGQHAAARWTPRHGTPSLRPGAHRARRRTPVQLPAVSDEDCRAAYGHRAAGGVSAGVAAALLAVLGVGGTLAGLGVLSGPPARPRPLDVEWNRETASSDEPVRFTARFSLAGEDRGVMVTFPTAGRWTAYLDGRKHFDGAVPAGGGFSMGGASRPLAPGEHRMSVLFEGTNQTGPPRLGLLAGP